MRKTKKQPKKTRLLEVSQVLSLLIKNIENVAYLNIKNRLFLSEL